MSNTIRWFESAAMDAPHLNSPQPCPRGIHCDYKLKNAAGELVPGCCRFVHPGEEGTGRRIFPERQIKERGPEASFRIQPACVRLTSASYYDRRNMKLSWREWCEKTGIPFTPALPGQPYEPVKRLPLGKRSAEPFLAPEPLANTDYEQPQNFIVNMVPYEATIASLAAAEEGAAQPYRTELEELEDMIADCRALTRPLPNYNGLDYERLD